MTTTFRYAPPYLASSRRGVGCRSNAPDGRGDRLPPRSQRPHAPGHTSLPARRYRPVPRRGRRCSQTDRHAATARCGRAGQRKLIALVAEDRACTEGQVACVVRHGRRNTNSRLGHNAYPDCPVHQVGGRGARHVPDATRYALACEVGYQCSSSQRIGAEWQVAEVMIVGCQGWLR